MGLKDIERKKVAQEWDMGWFCDKCDTLVSWKTKAYMIDNRKYCRDCAIGVCNRKNAKGDKK
jgi:hypothetical protein